MAKVVELNTRLPVVLTSPKKGAVHVFVVARCAQRGGTSVPESTLQALRTLGYRGGTSDTLSAEGTNKDMINDEKKLQMAKTAYRILHPKPSPESNPITCPHCQKSFKKSSKKKKEKKEKKGKRTP